MSNLLVPETISALYVGRKVCKFAPHMHGSSVDFAPHMAGSYADFALQLEQIHSFRDQRIAKIASFVNFQKELFKTTNVTTFDNKTILRERTSKW